jgi:hypothetical protein
VTDLDTTSLPEVLHILEQTLHIGHLKPSTNNYTIHFNKKLFYNADYVVVIARVSHRGLTPELLKYHFLKAVYPLYVYLEFPLQLI